MPSDTPQGSVPTDPEAELRLIETRRRIETLSAIIDQGRWNGRLTATAFAQSWCIPEAEVLRLHGEAAERLRVARGSLAAQRENSIAIYRKIRDDEIAYAVECDKASLAAAKEKDFKSATAHRALSSKARSSAMAAEREILAINQPERQPAAPARAAVTVNVGATSPAPDPTTWHLVVHEIMEPLYPGSARRLDAALAVWQGGGRPALTRWLGDQHALITEAIEIEAPP